MSGRGRKERHVCCSCLVSVWRTFLSADRKSAPALTAAEGGARCFTSLGNRSAHNGQNDHSAVLIPQLSKHRFTSCLISPLSSLPVPSRTCYLADRKYMTSCTLYTTPHLNNIHQIITIQKPSCLVTFKLSGSPNDFHTSLTDDLGSFSLMPNSSFVTETRL